ncbi:hypothetical protein LJK88_42565 [Paenibacillus sp. P26]|nr:hypothetical protein LJK88_42565 [Paenibacillus sp. P26]
MIGKHWKRMIRRIGRRRSLALPLIAALSVQCVTFVQPATYAAAKRGGDTSGGPNDCRRDPLSAEELYGLRRCQREKERAFIVTADMNDPTVNVISAKAKDKVLKLETLSQQIQREQFKGNNVVAGINGDMFNISAGTPTYGTPVGRR